ncbi:Uncharacterized protein APZ42_021236 [Daphnia magna]|uniref:Transposable element P transposase-like RNase H domain-containing protein n=1 Tax=Daphnia magna TaxID=35525 RepID=A0A164WUN9_9CRUS|nr:Uncharacterized protein APZ42_021236 [Daphnia magna]
MESIKLDAGIDAVSNPNLAIAISIEPNLVNKTQTNSNIVKFYICVFHVVELQERIPLPEEFMKRLRMETTLPCDGSWTISESNGTAYCQSYTYVNHTWFIRTLQFDSTDKELLNVVKTIEQEKEELMVLAKKDSLSIHLKTLPAQKKSGRSLKATLSKNDISGKGMRWDSTYLVQGAMIKMKSSSVYRSLREKELLPLPSEETLRKIVSSIECCFGRNELALFNVGEDMKGKHEPGHWCSFMWDEIKLKPDMDWDQRSKKLRGIVDYGETLFSKTNSAIHKNSKVSKLILCSPITYPFGGATAATTFYPISHSPFSTGKIGLEIFRPISPVLFRFGSISPATLTHTQY